MYSVYLSDALLTHPEHYDTVVAHMDDLRWAAQRITEVSDPELHEDEPCGELLQSIVLYTKAYKKLPDKKGTLDYATEMKSKGKSSGYADLVREQFDRLESEMADARKPPVRDVPTDINVLINATTEAARRLWHINNGKNFSRMANGGAEVPNTDGTKGKHKSTPDDAVSWFRTQLTRDLMRMSVQPSGDLTALKESVEAEIDRMVNGEDDERILTGLDCLDEHVYISKKRRQYIGIMGFMNDGKTTVLLTMLYNMAAAGRSVILFSKEHGAMESAMYFAFIHSHAAQYRKNGIQLPSYKEFEEGHCTKEQGEQLKEIWRDMQSNKHNFKGRIEIQPLTDWDTMTNHLKSNHARNKYDVCGMDYLTRTDFPAGNPRFHDNDVKVLIGTAQRFTRDFDEGRGIVLVTPIQINRSGFTAAKKKKEGERKHDVTSVGNFSEFYWDMDVLISLYSDDAMRLKRQVLVEVQKVRKSSARPSATLYIDPRSEKVVDLGDMGFDTDTQKWLDAGSPMSKFVEKTISVGDVQGSIFDTLDVVGGGA